MTPEELDEARGKEAVRRLVDSGQVYCHEDIAALGARLARENWTPPEPVDPDLLAFREWESAQWPAYTCTEAAYLAGARMAREQERERAKVLVEYLEENLGIPAHEWLLAKYRGEAYSDD